MTRDRVSRALASELDRHKRARRNGDTDAAWAALERAHILSQPMLGPHLQVHGLMLSFALQKREPGEAIGQVVRLLLAPLGALTGRLPWGNTGRSNVSPFEAMPIPEDLKPFLPRETSRR